MRTRKANDRYRRTPAAVRSIAKRPERPFSRPSLGADATVPGVRARVAPGRNLGQAPEVMGPAFRVPGALLSIRQAGVGQAQQRSVRLLD